MPKKHKPKSTSSQGCSINNKNWYLLKRLRLVPFEAPPDRWYLNSTDRSSESVEIFTKGLEREACLGSAIHKSGLHRNRAKAYISLGNFSEAKRDLEAVPDNMELARLYLGEQSAYAALYESSMNEATITAKSPLGIVHLCCLGPNALQNYDKAIQLAQESYKSSGSSADQSFYLAAILFRAGQYETALEHLTNM